MASIVNAGKAEVLEFRAKGRTYQVVLNAELYMACHEIVQRRASGKLQEPAAALRAMIQTILGEDFLPSIAFNDPDFQAIMDEAEAFAVQVMRRFFPETPAKMQEKNGEEEDPNA